MNEESMLERLRDAMKTRNAVAVAQETGVSYYLVREIKLGEAKNPRYLDVVKLAKYLGVME